MPLTISVDASKFKNLQRTVERQVRWATVTALTDTAQDLAKIEEATMRASIDRPTPFSQRGVRYQRATLGTMQSATYIAPVQAKYLRYQVDGGSQSYRKPAPIGASANQYGNLPRGALKGARVYHVRTDAGKLISFKRVGKGRGSRSIPLAVGTNNRRYAPIYPFYQRAQARVPIYFRRVYGRHLRSALAGAR